MGFLTRIRFLPVTIFAASVLLTVKIGSIVDGVDTMRGALISVSGASAQQQPQAGPKASSPAATGTTAAAAKTPASPVAEGPGPLASAEQGTSQKAFADDPTLLTQSEIDLLQRLAERRDALEAREREIAQREGLMRAAEGRIDKKVVELKQLQATIEGLIKTYDQQQDNKMESLVKIYENMKPKDAARIFEELDMDTLLMVAERMKERRLAPIMATMDPGKAKDVTVELARLRQMPKAIGKEGG